MKKQKRYSAIFLTQHTLKEKYLVAILPDPGWFKKSILSFLLKVFCPNSKYIIIENIKEIPKDINMENYGVFDPEDYLRRVRSDRENPISPSSSSIRTQDLIVQVKKGADLSISKKKGK